MLNTQALAPKQLEFILNSTAKWNFAHGSVRSGKTICTLFRFLQAAKDCPNNEIYMLGHTSDTVFRNAILPLLESPQLSCFRPFCTWFKGDYRLKFMDKTIKIIGVKDAGSIGVIQGCAMSLVYCDEFTLYPDSVIQMIDTRLSYPHSMGFASMNPTFPDHLIKQWIDKAHEGDKNYYALHFNLDDNPYLASDYKERIRNSTSGVFYKRNYLGLWCLAEGAIFDFFDRALHVVTRPPRAADYWVAGIDFGTSNAFACVLVGVFSGMRQQMGKCLWVEKEYYWDCKKTGRQKTNSEFAEDVKNFLEPYGVQSIYIDPSAAAMKLDLQKRGMHVVAADNDVYNGIQVMTSEMSKGNLFVCSECKNLIREIENYVWDKKKSEQGIDQPVKKSDHAVDALRYVINTHKPNMYDAYKDEKYRQNWLKDRFERRKYFT